LAPELAAGVEDVLDDELAPDAADDVLELLLLLLPQPTITAALNSATSTADTRLQELLKIRLLLGGPQFRARICNKCVPDRRVNRLPMNQFVTASSYGGD
jgi:hypothetical protein